MNIIGALIVVAVFVLMLRVLKLIQNGVGVMTTSRRAWEVLRDRNLDDDAKGELMQRQAKRLFVLFFLLSFSAAAALLVPVGLAYALDIAGLFSFDGVMGMLVSWEFLLVMTIVPVLVIWVFAKR